MGAQRPRGPARRRARRCGQPRRGRRGDRRGRRDADRALRPPARRLPHPARHRRGAGRPGDHRLRLAADQPGGRRGGAEGRKLLGRRRHPEGLLEAPGHPRHARGVPGDPRGHHQRCERPDQRPGGHRRRRGLGEHHGRADGGAVPRPALRGLQRPRRRLLRCGRRGRGARRGHLRARRRHGGARRRHPHPRGRDHRGRRGRPGVLGRRVDLRRRHLAGRRRQPHPRRRAR